MGESCTCNTLRVAIRNSEVDGRIQWILTGWWQHKILEVSGCAFWLSVFTGFIFLLLRKFEDEEAYCISSLKSNSPVSVSRYGPKFKNKLCEDVLTVFPVATFDFLSYYCDCFLETVNRAVVND